MVLGGWLVLGQPVEASHLQAGRERDAFITKQITKWITNQRLQFRVVARPWLGA